MGFGLFPGLFSLNFTWDDITGNRPGDPNNPNARNNEETRQQQMQRLLGMFAMFVLLSFIFFGGDMAVVF